jgi:hypothetical protein
VRNLMLLAEKWRILSKKEGKAGNKEQITDVL